MYDIDKKKGKSGLGILLGDKNFWNKGQKYSDNLVLEHYPSDKHSILEGKRGSVFIEDTYCLHKGITPISRDRYILQFIFSVSRTPFMQPSVIASNLSELDPKVFRYFL